MAKMPKEIYKSNFAKNRDIYITELCKNKKVLHIGACDAPYTLEKHAKNRLLFKLIDEVAKEQLGIDIDKEGLEIMKNLGFNNIAHINMNNSYQIDFEPDIIIFGETIEHIMNLENALNSLKTTMSEDTRLVISTPNFITFTKIIVALSGKEFQHPDHNLLMTYKTLEQLINKVGLTVEIKKFTFLTNHTESLWGKADLLLARFFPIFASTLLFVVKK